MNRLTLLILLLLAGCVSTPDMPRDTAIGITDTLRRAVGGE
ncbi:hypothetical protein [Mesorhizobium sp. B2-8-9]|nr:hypothetical protein [Mesorhizobium sp. B2-8-9]